jgi:hypothetical protein
MLSNYGQYEEKMKNLFLTASLLFILNGCAAFLVGGAAGVGGVYYVRGELRSTVAHNISSTWRATEAAARQLQLEVRESSADQTAAKLSAKNAAGSDITIRLVRESAQVTELRIRVGLMGDKKISEQILEQIKANL